MVGKSAGLGGLALFEGGEARKCFGAPGEVPYSYTHTAFGGGPVCAGAVMTVNDAVSGGPLASSRFALFHDRYENHVRIAAAENLRGRGGRVAPGMAKFRDEHVTLDEREGFLLAWGRPVDEYGIIGTAFVWRPDQCRDIHETGDTRFILLDPGDDGAASYRSVGVWYRASAEQPAAMEPFTALVRELAIGLNNPVRMEIH
jgi:hypothetical protein